VVTPWRERLDAPADGEAVCPELACAPWRKSVMAKALLGYVGGPDPRLVTEVRRLQRRVVDLEAEILRLRAENDSLLEMVDAPSVTLDEVAPAEPVLA
jgi:hypothetical protein